MLCEARISPEPRSSGDDEQWRNTDGSWGGSALGETGSRGLTPPRELERQANTEFDSVPEPCHISAGTETLLSNAVFVRCHTAGNAPVADYMNTRGIGRALLQLQDAMSHPPLNFLSSHMRC